jgi:glycosyltransferase involved in cell wall biosynthesis
MNRITKSLMKQFAGGRQVMLATGVGSQPPAPRMVWMHATAISDHEIATVHPNLDRVPGAPFRLAYAGRLSCEKGVKYLLRALGLLHGSGKAPDSALNLVLFGDGPQRTELEALARQEGITGWVEFAGQVDREVLTRRLLEADVVVLPSLTEGFCKASLDAMLCGAPVVMTEVGFGRHITGMDGERGWLVPHGNAEALANVLLRLLSTPLDWPALRRRCRAYVDGQTLESWACHIGEICARQWGISLVEGKLQG